MSKLVAILPVRNEAWCIGLTLRALLMWVEVVVVTLHACTDDTERIVREIADEYPGRVMYGLETDRTWHEMSQRDFLLKIARTMLSPTHIVILDADELVTGNLLPKMRGIIDHIPTGAILQLPWLQLRGGIDRVHTSGLWGEQFASSAFKDDPRWHWAPQAGGYDHHHRHPMGMQHRQHRPILTRQAGVMHLQMASDRRLRAKHALYVMQETLRWPGRKTHAQLNAMYGPTVYRVDGMGDVMPEWWAPYRHLMQHLNVDAEPWQEAEVRRLLAEHGAARFEGLDLYGVDLAPVPIMGSYGGGMPDPLIRKVVQSPHEAPPTEAPAPNASRADTED